VVARRRIALAAGLSLALASCSLGYDGQVKEAPVLPSAVFSDYSHTIVVRGRPAFTLEADRAEVYAEEKRTVLSAVRFAEYDPDTGDLLSSGSADRAVYWTESEDAELSGAVRLESKRQEAVLEGEYLRWDGEGKRLEGRLDRAVTVRKTDGSWVSGAGFEADARRRSFVFREGVAGVAVPPEDGEE